jgi:hypothetical protein
MVELVVMVPLVDRVELLVLEAAVVVDTLMVQLLLYLLS